MKKRGAEFYDHSRSELRVHWVENLIEAFSTFLINNISLYLLAES